MAVATSNTIGTAEVEVEHRNWIVAQRFPSSRERTANTIERRLAVKIVVMDVLAQRQGMCRSVLSAQPDVASAEPQAIEAPKLGTLSSKPLPKWTSYLGMEAHP